MKILLAILLIFFIVSPSLCARLEPRNAGSDSVFNVVSYGAKGNGHDDDSNAFLKAWEAVCGATQDKPIFLIPKGKTFMLQPVMFQGPCKSTNINFQLQGVITAPESINWKWAKNSYKDTWIMFSNINGLKVNGGGQIDGKGDPWWKLADDSDRPTALRFLNCDQLTLRSLTHINSQRNHISIDTCNGTLISDLKIIAPDLSPNTDGIDIAGSSNIVIQNSNIQTGDDCVAINSGSSFINITGVFCGPGHGISVGSLGKNQAYATVEQVTVHNCTFTGTQNGARIKTWVGGSGYARNIKFDDIILNGVKNPMIIDQHYSNYLLSSDQDSKAVKVKVSDVTYNNVRGTSASEYAIQFECDKRVGGCTNIVLKNIDITNVGEDKTNASCDNAKGICFSCNPIVPCLSSH